MQNRKVWLSLGLPLFLGLILLYQNCAPDAPSGSGLFQYNQDSQLDPSPDEYGSPPSGSPPPLSATPPPASAFQEILTNDREWNPGADVVDDDPNKTPAQIQADLDALTAKNTNWFNAQAAGPVASYTMYVMRLARGGAVIANPAPDARGCLKVQAGDLVWVDTTQKNGSGVAQCKWSNMKVPNMRWHSSNPDQFWDSPKDFQPFWVRFKPQVAGADVWLYATLDGVKSNYICLTTK